MNIIHSWSLGLEKLGMMKWSLKMMRSADEDSLLRVLITHDDTGHCSLMNTPLPGFTPQPSKHVINLFPVNYYSTSCSSPEENLLERNVSRVLIVRNMRRNEVELVNHSVSLSLLRIQWHMPSKKIVNFRVNRIIIYFVGTILIIG